MRKSQMLDLGCCLSWRARARALALTFVSSCTSWLILTAAVRAQAEQPAKLEHTAELGNCGDPATPISTIQGTEKASKFSEKAKMVVEAVVIADLQQSSFNGFYLQEEDDQHDSNPNTSEGLFIYQADNTVDVAVGDVVRVLGFVYEFENLTEITGPIQVKICSHGAKVTPTVLETPIRDRNQLEALENMLVTIDKPLTVTGTDYLTRFGMLDLAIGGRLFVPTQTIPKGKAAVEQQWSNDSRRIVLDDADGRQFSKPIPFKSAENTRRVGDTLNGLTGILDEHFESYRIQPIGKLDFVAANPRPAPPAKSGKLRVVSANLNNYFKSLDDGKQHCGPTGEWLCRGANTPDELNRQRAKIVTALMELDADVIGISELENGQSEPMDHLLEGLNDAAGKGTYAAIPTGTLGKDAIKVGLIYKPAKVEPHGKFAVLDASADKRFDDARNRPALAQTFEEKATRGRFTVAVNHWKIRTLNCNEVNDRDLEDGQAHCNKTRTSAANVLVDWLKTDPTGSGDPDFLVIGDLNAYAKEDPILALERGGYTSLMERLGPEAYTFVYEAQSGYVDHALATASLAPQVTSIAVWHINADEPSSVDFNTEHKTDDLFKADQPYRMSNHDPIVLELDLTPSAPESGRSAMWWGIPGVVLAIVALRLLQLRRAREAAKKR
jgi:predicted extracellular nuclease